MAHLSDHAVLLARTDVDVPKRRGITYFLLDLDQPGVEVGPCGTSAARWTSTRCSSTGAWVPDDQRVGAVGDGWKVANATLSGERQMVSGAGSGGVDRIGGRAPSAWWWPPRPARPPAARGRRRPGRPPAARGADLRGAHPGVDQPAGPGGLQAGRSPGPESSIGKVHQGDLNQRIQLLATDLLGAGALAGTRPPGLDAYADSPPYEVKGMLRSRANTIEGGTTEVNKNVVAERVLPASPTRGATLPGVTSPQLR